MKFVIHEEKVVRHGFLSIVEADVAYDTWHHGTKRLKREKLERGNSVAVLLFETDTQTFLFTKQFRYPVAQHEVQRGSLDAGWIVELPAGGVYEGEDMEQAIIREVEEECGYELQHIEIIQDMYASPGGTSECIRVFYAETTSAHQKYPGGGARDEDEDIAIVRIPAAEIKNHSFIDGKTALACFWWLLHKASKT